MDQELEGDDTLDVGPLFLRGGNHAYTDLKQSYRRKALECRRALTPRARVEASNRIQKTVLQQLARFRPTAKAVLVYRAMRDEVATDTILALERWEVFAPLVDERGCLQWRRVGPDCIWRSGRFGVEEPCNGPLWLPSRGPVVVLCPLVAFDRNGNRLGFGLGFFDRWLDEHAPSVTASIGLAFSCQEAPRIPAEGHDVPMDFVITEHEIIACRKS